jgi:hypothetical protein
MLEVPRSFTMLIPEGWSANFSDGVYQLTRDSDEGAIHVSTYERNAGRIDEHEAEQVLTGFVKSTGASTASKIRVLREGRNQHRAVTRFVVDDDGVATEWLMFAILWRDRLVLCSCNARPGSAMFGEAEQMFASIFPPKKGLFR